MAIEKFTKHEEGKDTTKYKLIFLPDEEYLLMKGMVNPKRITQYAALITQGIENFSIETSKVVYIPQEHRAFMTNKANNGEMI
jgi:hypothetical protein